jgi:DNA helicase-2/ATP-dependent DNA helicase PcrA
MNHNLSEEQRQIAFYQDCEGALLVEAAAGSGKTRLLTERVRYLLTEKKDKFFSVLCLTFTNKAADEMKERLKNVLKLKERAYIGTFHEFCLEKIVRPRYGEIGLAAMPHIFDENDQRKTIEEAISSRAELKEKLEITGVTDAKQKAKKQRELLDECTNFISSAKRGLVIVPELETNWEDWDEVETILYQEYNTRLINQNAMDYDDILLYAYRILNNRPGTADLYRRTYQYIMVDEAQDMNYAQYQIIRSICGDSHRNVMMVGDPRQAIYGFNGASPSFMQDEFIKDFVAEKKALNQNFRSAQRVLELAQQIQANGGIGNNYFNGESELHSFENEAEEASWVIAQIKSWLKIGQYVEIGKEVVEPIDYQDIAVLARNKFVFGTLIAQLEEDDDLKDKFYLRKGVERFEPESILVKIFDLGLRLLVNPADVLHRKQLLNELRLSVTTLNDGNIESLLELHQHSTEFLSKEALAKLSDLWGKLLKNSKWTGEAIKQLLDCVEKQCLGLIDEESVKANFDLLELQKQWNAFARKTPVEQHQLVNFRYFLALSGAKEHPNQLTLATVHTTKGLEYAIVFLIGMNDGVFPDYRAKTDSALQEERNNAYVAITRAKRCIYITRPQRRIMPWGDSKVQDISRFIRYLQFEAVN